MEQPQRRFPGLDRTVVSLGLASFFNDVASEMIYPLLPLFLAVTLGAGAAAVGVVEGIAEATAAVGKGVFGWISDRRTTQKPLVIAGYAISTAVRPLIALAQAWGVVAAIRFTDRVGKGIRAAPRDAMIASSTDPGKRGLAYGFERAMDNAGALLGPLLAALLLRFFARGMRLIFALSVVPGLCAVAIIAFATKEERAVRTSPALPEKKEAGGPFPRTFYVLVAIFALFAFANSTDAFLLLRARQCGVALWVIPILWGVFNGVRALLNTPLGALADRMGNVPAILIGWGIYAVAYYGFGRAGSPQAIWLLLIFYALFYAFTEGAERALVADFAGPGRRGRAFGIFYMTSGLAALPASILFGVIWKTGTPRLAFDISAGVALLAAILLLGFATASRRSIR